MCVDEVRVCDQGSGETNGGAIEGSDQELGEIGERAGDIEVVGYEALQGAATDVLRFGDRRLTEVCSAILESKYEYPVE